MTAYASPGHPELSTHHVVLTNGATVLGLQLCNSRGERDERAVQRLPIPRSSLKMYTGAQKYADLEPPWTPVDQVDWSGGRGGIDFDVDSTKYND